MKQYFQGYQLKVYIDGSPIQSVKVALGRDQIDLEKKIQLK